MRAILSSAVEFVMRTLDIDDDPLGQGRRIQDDPREEIPPVAGTRFDRPGGHEHGRGAACRVQHWHRVAHEIAVAVVERNGGGAARAASGGNLEREPGHRHHVAMPLQKRDLASEAIWRHRQLPWIVRDRLDPMVEKDDWPLDPKRQMC